jgi:polyisoprenoid-binding protein YceI
MRLRNSCLILAVTACLAAPALAQDLPIEQRPAPAGTYHGDLSHTRVIFSVNHLGFSNFLALFRDVEATLIFDPETPETMQLSARVGLGSVETFYPNDDLDFNAEVAGPNFLNATPDHPDATFESTEVTLTGEKTADVTGDMTLNGVTKPVTLHVTFNGGYAGHPLDAGARIGFSATGELNRSEFDLGFFVPAPGTTMGVSDRVGLIIEIELINPDAPKE